MQLLIFLFIFAINIKLKNMDNLENLFQRQLKKKEQQEIELNKKQNQILKETYNKCEEIVRNLSFLTKYGFSFNIASNISDDYGSYYGFERYYVKMGVNGHHFAILYPCTSGQYDVSSYQIEFEFHRKFYTYESLILAISERVVIKHE